MEPVLQQGLGQEGLAQAFDVHGVPTGECRDGPAAGPGRPHWGNGWRPRPPRPHRPRLPQAGAPAGKALGLPVAGLCPAPTRTTSGMILAGFADDDRVADADVLLADVVLVVQGGPLHRRAGNAHGSRVHAAGVTRRCAPLLDLMPTTVVSRSSGGELVGDGPTGSFGVKPSRPLLAEVVHLDHQAVDLIRQVVAPLLPALDPAR